jgi:hypothetical protein
MTNMLTPFEKFTRIKEYFNVSKEERNSLLAVIFITSFIFSIKFPGENFSVMSWLYYFCLTTLVVGFVFVVRLSMQKIQGLWRGYLVEFKVWWGGVIASLILAFLSFGWITVIFAGTITSTFMVRQRLGEFRYGYSYGENAAITNWGMVSNVIMSLIFGFLLYFYPTSYIFKTGLILNLVIAFCQYLPLPQLEGLQIYFGSRFIYGLWALLYVAVAILTLTQTKIGLIFAIVTGALIGIGVLLWSDL